MLDYFIKNGHVLDGSGQAAVETNIGIQGDRIVYIGRDVPDARNTIDAKGLVVTPGFIDAHAHSEFTILADGRAEGKVSQGITTEINGNCGMSAAPLRGDAFDHREADLIELGIKERWHSFSEYFDILLTKGIAINFYALCGHGNIRASVIGYKDKSPDKHEMSEMKNLLTDAVREGAKGLSTGLIYPPGVYSGTDELIDLCKALSGQGIYTSHMRSEGDRLIEAIEEVIKIGREAGINIHISHIKTSGERNWSKIDRVVELIEDARREGIKLTCDRYPYTAASTDLDIILPSWCYDGGVEEELRRLKDIKTREKIRAEISGKGDAYWKGVYVSSVTKAENKWMEGENLFDISEKMKRPPEDALIDITIDEKARSGAIFFSMSEDNLRRFLALPYAMIGTDSSARSFSGPTCKGKPHPRGFGSFPRFIGKYVRDEGIIGLPEAIKKATYLPALTFGIKRRGLLKEGFFADIAVFNYEKIKDNSSFKDPYLKPDGIKYVFVNGRLSVKRGEITESLSGSILR